jgi:hypothetical protein
VGRFARGDKALGISDRSGAQYLLKDMRKEWTGALVGKDEYEPKHPQLQRRQASVDPQAIRNPRPESVLPIRVLVGIKIVGSARYYPIVGNGQIGNVEVVIS